MKKIALLLLSLALIVGCLFALSSCQCEHEFDPSAEVVLKAAKCEEAGEAQNVCTKCKETVKYATPMLNHSWATVKTVDMAATCIATGSESYHCTHAGCNVKNDSTTIPMDSNNHTVDSWTITKEPSALANGTKVGKCAFCSNNVTAEVSNEDNITVIKNTVFTDRDENWYTTKTYDDILGAGKHFYPTTEDSDGNDLFIEFSVLWNEWAKKGPNTLNVRLWGYKNTNNRTLFQINLKDNIADQWGTQAGTFEPCLINDYTEDSPYKGKKGSTLYNTQDATKSLPGLTDYGWYRIGIRVHQEVTIEAGAAKYSGVASVYLNGELVLKWNMKYHSDNGEPDNPNGLLEKGGVLYKAKVEEGQLVFSDNTDGFGAYVFIEGYKTKNDFYLPLGDISFSAGKNFVMPVKKVATLDATKTLILSEDKTVPATALYEVDMPAQPTEIKVLASTDAECPSGWGYKQNAFLDRKQMNNFDNGDTKFYPTTEDAQGNDLFIEFSLLWNDTLNWAASDSVIDIGRLDWKGGPNVRCVAYLHLGSGDKNAPFAGAIETCYVGEVLEGNASPVNGTRDQYTILTNGWHRIGIQLHQEAEVVSATATKNTMIYSLYVDGELIIKAKTTDEFMTHNPSDGTPYGAQAYTLYETALDPADQTNSTIKYVAHPDNDTYKVSVYCFRIDGYFGKSAERYLPIADASYSIGKSFKQNVVKVTDTVTDYMFAGASKLESTMHYKVVTE